MNLLEVYNTRVVPSAHALVLPPYKDIWEKDTSKSKLEAINVFSYAEFLLSPKKSNPFFGIAREARPKEIKKRLWGNDSPDLGIYSELEMIRVIEAYRMDLSNWSPSYTTLLDAIETAENVREYLRTTKLDEKSRGGTLLLKPKDVTSALKEIPEIIKTLEDTRNRVISELDEAAKTRKGREIGLYER